MKIGKRIGNYEGFPEKPYKVRVSSRCCEATGEDIGYTGTVIKLNSILDHMHALVKFDDQSGNIGWDGLAREYREGDGVIWLYWFCDRELEIYGECCMESGK